MNQQYNRRKIDINRDIFPVRYVYKDAPNTIIHLRKVSVLVTNYFAANEAVSYQRTTAGKEPCGKYLRPRLEVVQLKRLFSEMLQF